MAVITVTKDTEIREDEPDNNLGSAQVAYVGEVNGKKRNVVMGFDIFPIPPGSDISEAKLSLRNAGRVSLDISIFRLTSDWQENDVSWNYPWSTPGGDYDNSLQIDGTLNGAVVTDFDIKPIVEKWVKENLPCYGVLIGLKISDNVMTPVATKENTSLEKPKFVINYTSATPTQQIDAGYMQIEALPDSDFFKNRGKVAKRIFKRLSNTAKILISYNLVNQAKFVLEAIIRLMDGSGFDLITNPASRDRIRPFYEQAKAGV